MHKPIEGSVPYQDFDSVLHPDAVFRVHGKVLLRFDGAALREAALHEMVQLVA